MSTTSVDISRFTRLRPASPMGLAELREAAMARFSAVGLPRGDEEEWRFTNTDPLAEIAWQLPSGTYATGDDRSCFAVQDSLEVILVNGVLTSVPDRLPKGLWVGALSAAPAEIAAAAQARLGTACDLRKTPFAALNTALLNDVLIIHAARGAAIDVPVHVLSLAKTAGSPLLFAPRLLVIAEEGSILKFAETHAGHDEDAAMTNTVVEVFADAGAVVEHYQTQWNSPATSAIQNTVTTLAASAVYSHYHAALSGKLIRNDLEIVLNGERADATLTGLVFTSSERHVDNHTLIRHEKANCTSHELYKHVVADESTAIFKGRIFVQKDAQKTDSKQTSRTLLLSDRATMQAMPALEIYADDVKCTHGSTTGPLDDNMLFYLRSRGLSTDAARHLLIYAFAADITARMKVPALRRQIEQFLAAQQDLPRDLSIEANV